MQLSATASENIVQRWVSWMPLWLGLGIAGYFLLPFEPSAKAALALPVLLAAAYALRGRIPLLQPVLALLAVLSGFLLAEWETARHAHPILAGPIEAGVNGRIVEVVPVGHRQSVTLDRARIEGLPEPETPPRLHVSLPGNTALMSGQHIAMRAHLSPPSRPLMPGSFDFGRYFYYRDIGAIGYALPPIAVSAEPKRGFRDMLTQWMSQRRLAIKRYYIDALPGEAGKVAATLATGDQNLISPDVSAMIRTAGLPHILVVSGMHMTIVCGLIFAMVRLCLAAIPGAAHHIDVKKAAAGSALVIGGFYLWLAGFPIAAIRASVMILLYLGGMLLGRRSDALRSLVLAAIVIFVTMPSSLLDPSFELSFAAVLALILFFRHWHAADEAGYERRTALRLAGVYLLDTALTTVVATAATTPAAIYHFHEFGPYGLLANMFAVPLTSFYIAPLMILAIPASLIGLDKPLLAAAGFGIDGMLHIAARVAALPHAQIHVPPFSLGGLLLMVGGGLLLLISGRRVKLAGVALVLLGIASAWQNPLPDLLVSSDGRAVAARLPDRWQLLKGSPREFSVGEWQQATGGRYDATEGLAKDCDGEGCVYHLDGHLLALPRYPEAVYDDCAFSELVVMPDAVRAAPCHARLIDRAAIASGGAFAVRFSPGGMTIENGCAVSGERPWTRCGTRSYPPLH